MTSLDHFLQLSDFCFNILHFPETNWHSVFNNTCHIMTYWIVAPFQGTLISLFPSNSLAVIPKVIFVLSNRQYHVIPQENQAGIVSVTGSLIQSEVWQKWLLYCSLYTMSIYSLFKLWLIVDSCLVLYWHYQMRPNSIKDFLEAHNDLWFQR